MLPSEAISVITTLTQTRVPHQRARRRRSFDRHEYLKMDACYALGHLPQPRVGCGRRCQLIRGGRNIGHNPRQTTVGAS
jgi:hypothetical protein